MQSKLRRKKMNLYSVFLEGFMGFCSHVFQSECRLPSAFINPYHVNMLSN